MTTTQLDPKPIPTSITDDLARPTKKETTPGQKKGWAGGMELFRVPKRVGGGRKVLSERIPGKETDGTANRDKISPIPSNLPLSRTCLLLGNIQPSGRK